MSSSIRSPDAKAVAAREGRGEDDGVRDRPGAAETPAAVAGAWPPLNSISGYSRNGQVAQNVHPEHAQRFGRALAGTRHYVAFNDRADGAELREPVQLASRCSSMPPARRNDLE